MEKRSDKTNSGNEETNKYPPSDSISIKDGVDITDTQTEDVQCSDEPLTLDKLPVEILMYICSYLDAKFLVHSLSKVCRSFKDLFVSDIYWKIRIKKRWSKPYPTVYNENFSWREACIDREESYRVWTSPETTCHHFFYKEGIFAPVDVVHLMNNGTLLASGSRDRYLNILDLTKYDPDDPASVKAMKVYADSKAHKGWIWSLASHDNRLCSGSWDTYIKLWDLNNGVSEYSKYKCKSAVLGVHFEANQIFAAGYDRHVYMVDPREGEVHRKRYHRRPVLCLAADDKYVVTGSEDKTIAVFDRRAGQVYKTMQLESYAMDISFGHDQLWVADKDGRLQLYDASLGQFEHILTFDVGHKGKATGVVYTPGALFSCSTDSTIKVLEPSVNPEAYTTIKDHTAAVTRFFPPLKNDLILRAARGEKTERTPVWLMRQAGRYLPEYGEFKLKNSASFFDMVRNPESACEITLQPLKRFDLDAAIIFSDILVIPQALGIGIEIEEGKGMTFDFLLQTPEDLKKLNTIVDVTQELHYVMDAITLTRQRLEGRCPLIGFAGAPWTIMKYMIDGSSSAPVPKARRWLVEYPEASNSLLQLLTTKTIDYLVAQVKAGAQMLQVFDSNAGELGPALFNEYGLTYLRLLAYGVKERLTEQNIEHVPMTVFAKDVHFALEDLSNSGYEVISIDWTIKPTHARRLVGSHVTLQGNLDPCMLYATKEELKHNVKDMVAKFGPQRYIANLGHGVIRDTQPEKVQTFVDSVHIYSEEMNAIA
uniref:Uroporphyrinogen decarboxylase n=1 Tax=Crassostrea virginica TaxID=6565 RepID=A0A8B8CBJ6_CRAVI|nr:uncharacterized protein LOC111118050 [Crassostrea virginica]